MRWLPAVALTLGLAFACGGGGSIPVEQTGTGGTSSGPVVYDEQRAIDNCTLACTPYVEACSADCADGCDDDTRLSSAEDCPAEFDEYFGCIAAAAPADFDCEAGDIGTDNPVAACATSWLAYSQCRRTRGFECVIITHDASVCTSADAATPNWVTCKVDEDPPSACVTLDSTDYCCPDE
jgi:hypothetical protein